MPKRPTTAQPQVAYISSPSTCFWHCPHVAVESNNRSIYKALVLTQLQAQTWKWPRHPPKKRHPILKGVTDIRNVFYNCVQFKRFLLHCESFSDWRVFFFHTSCLRLKCCMNPRHRLQPGYSETAWGYTEVDICELAYWCCVRGGSEFT